MVRRAVISTAFHSSRVSPSSIANPGGSGRTETSNHSRSPAIPAHPGRPGNWSVVARRGVGGLAQARERLLALGVLVDAGPRGKRAGFRPQPLPGRRRSGAGSLAVLIGEISRGVSAASTSGAGRACCCRACGVRSAMALMRRRANMAAAASMAIWMAGAEPAGRTAPPMAATWRQRQTRPPGFLSF